MSPDMKFPIIIVAITLLGIAARPREMAWPNPQQPPAITTEAQPVQATTPAAAKQPPLPAPVNLTEAETTELDLAEERGKSLDQEKVIVDLQVEQKFHFAERKAKLAADSQALIAKWAKAHRLDMTKFTFDEGKRLFVPKPPVAKTDPASH